LPIDRAGLLVLVKLHSPLMGFRGFPGAERSKIAATPGLWVFFAGI
jgi:hypothetical protein